MTPQFLTVLIAVTGFACGALLCWLVMRSRAPIAAAPEKLQLDTKLTLVNERVRTLEATLQEQQQANQQALLGRSAVDAANAESMRLVAARLAAAEDENGAFRRNAALMTLTPAVPSPSPAPRDTPVTQLPSLETEVLALQTLAKTIQQEFMLLTELHRTYTSTAATIQELVAAAPAEDMPIVA